METYVFTYSDFYCLLEAGGPTPRSRLDAVDEEGDVNMDGMAGGRNVHYQSR